MPLLVRNRLSRKFTEAPERVTLLAAGPGFGKSVAIRQLQAASNAAMLHYEVRARSFVPFVSGLVESASPFAPGLRPSFAGAIEIAMQSSKPHEEVALWMLDHLSAAHVDTIAIEDIQRAAADERVLQFLVRLVAGAPKHTRWILAARKPEELPERALADAGIPCARVGEDDLRLAFDEASKIAKSAAVSGRDVRAVFDLTGGHPAVFHFAAHVFEANDAPDGNAYEFYGGRYFDRLPPAVRDMLLGLSVLDEVDQAFLKRSPWAGVAEHVGLLAATGLVFSPSGEGRYRMHEPFRALLNERIGSEQERRASQRAAALILENCGAIARALELYLEAGDGANVLRLCERHGFDLADQGRVDALRRAFAQIDERDLHRSAVLLALKGIAESLAGRTDTAESWYMHALRVADEPKLRATVAQRYAVDLIRQGRAQGVDVLEPYAGEGSLHGELAASIHATLATAYVVASRFEDARAAVERALQFSAACESPAVLATIAQQAAWVALFTGNVAEAKQHALRAVELARSCGLYDVAARALSVLYNISYEVEDDASASMRILNDIWDCGMKAGDLRARLFALLGIFDIAAELGDVETLAKLERSLDAHEIDYADPMVSQALLPAQALRVAAAGEFMEAFRLLKPTAERQITDDRRALRHAEIALYAAAAGDLHEARAAIAQVLERLDGLEPTVRRTVRTRAVLAVALYLAGRRSDAYAHLRSVSAARENMSNRLAMLAQTLEVLFERWDGASNFDRLLDALYALRASDFGGLAAVLAAMPYKIPVNAA